MLTTLHLAAIVVVTVVAFFPALSGTFVSDDFADVRDKALIRALDWPHVHEIFRTMDGPNYMPFKVLSFAIDYRVWGPGPWGFHVTNLALHTVAALVVYGVLRRLAMAPWTAVLAALLWAVHPIQVESVAWIAERKNVLSVLCFLLAFACYLAYSRRPRAATYVATSAFFVVAILTKMTTVVLPAVCVVHELVEHGRLRRHALALIVPLFLLVPPVVAYNLAGNPVHGGDYHGGSALVSGLSSAVVVWRYLGLLLDPRGVSNVYDVTLHGSLLDPPVLAAVLGLVVVAVVTLVQLRARTREGFWLAWFGITLLPLLNVVPFRSMMNDRHVYLASLGIFALVAMAAQAAAGNRRARPLVALVAIGAVGGCGALTARRCAAWATPLDYWLDADGRHYVLGADPPSTRPEADGIMAAMRGTIARDPRSAIAHNTLGALLLESGQLDEARAHLETARDLDPEAAPVLVNLGRVDAHLGRMDDGAAVLQRAVALDPYSFMAAWLLADVELARGDAAAARPALEACRRLEPSSFASSPVLRAEREALARQRRAEPSD